MHHELKIAQPFFQQVIDGNKKFEIRNNSDRGFQTGDTVALKEIRQNMPTGREQRIEISYVSDYNQPPNQVVFAFTLTGKVTNT